MSEKVKGVIKLTRFQESWMPHLLVTVIGVFTAARRPDLGLFALVIIANLLSATFSFMVNDVEDWEDDAQDPKKKLRNPISAGQLTYWQGNIASFFVAIMSLVTFAAIGNTVVFVFGALSLVIGYLYSWKKVRLKSKPLVDIISHSYFLMSFALLTGYFAFSEFQPMLLVALGITVLSSIKADLYNEIRDFEVDRLSGLKNTAALIGLERTKLFRRAATVSAVFLAVLFGVMHVDKLNVYVLAISVLSFIVVASYSYYRNRRLKIFESGGPFLPVSIILVLAMTVSMYA